MFSESSTFLSCYSGECGTCHGCIGGENNPYIGYKFPRCVEGVGARVSEEEKRKKKVTKQFQEIKNITISAHPEENIKRVVSEYDDISSYHERMKDITEGLLADYEEGETIPGKYLSFTSRVNPSIGGTYEVEESGYLYRMEHYKSMYDLDSDKFDDYVRQFPEFKKKIEKVMDEHGWISRETPGNMPLETMYSGKKYTLIQDEFMDVLCDDPECTLIAHCTIETDPSGLISDYYRTLPYYTHNKKHELCSLCALK